jgi:3-oxoacyl-[acyl-carrier protein] reductase
MNRLDGKVAVITGAAMGIGRASALQFAAEGARVVVNDIDAGAAEASAAAIRATGGEAVAVGADVTDPAASREIAATAVATWSRIDVWFSNAGGAMPTPMREITDEHYEQVIALNLDSVWHGTQAALEVMVPQRSGCILATSSGAGLGATPGLSAYGAAKAGLIALMRSVALEHGPEGIRANVISPGPIASPGFLAFLETVEGGAKRFGEQVPLRRLGRPEDIAAAAVFLASDEAAFVSGVVLPVDGAIHATAASPKMS